MADRILVTGAASGIGAATLLALNESERQALGADRRQVAEGVVLDVTSEESWAEVLDELWPLHGLVNCAGVRYRAHMVDTDVAAFQQTLSVNVVGTFLGMREMARRWERDECPGRIVNVGSLVGEHAVPGQIDYAASKGAVAAVTRAAAVELAAGGIRVNAVAPGVIRTPMTEARLADSNQASWIKSRVPSGEVGSPSEVASCIAFLLSAEASYVNGAVLPVDGGWAAG